MNLPSIQEPWTENLALDSTQEAGTLYLGGSNLTLSETLDHTSKSPMVREDISHRGLTTSTSKLAEYISKAAKEFPQAHIQPKQGNKERSLALQEWEGYVTDISEDGFIAELVDITNPETPNEQGDFLISDLRNDDLALLRPGAVFRWIIGYEVTNSGGKRRFSQIIFRRLPQWTQSDISNAASQAKSLVESISWE